VAENMMKPSSAQRVWMYTMMRRSRLMEEACTALYREGKSPVFDMAAGPLPGELHQSNGQEPAAMGVLVHLGPEDIVSGTHRAHHIAVGRGVDLKRMSAELLGKKTGLSGGRGGHMHLYDKTVNFSCSGIIGEGLGPAAGAALARKMQNEPGLSVCYIGEGAANQGAFHEVLNMAALWKLPFLCIIEDNNWGATTEKKVSTAVEHNSVRALAYGIHGEHVAGNDPDIIFDAAGRAIERIRRGEGPVLLEIETARLIGHFFGDTQRYIPAEQASSATRQDPLPKYRQRLLDENVATAEELAAIDEEQKRIIDGAIKFAVESDYPEPEEALDQVFC
jgi:acetoin:2,6-dichlorophenolindophenol oxidoreductase subunit alpha